MMSNETDKLIYQSHSNENRINLIKNLSSHLNILLTNCHICLSTEFCYLVIMFVAKIVIGFLQSIKFLSKFSLQSFPFMSILSLFHL